MSSALMRGRTLNPVAVQYAKRWRKQRIGLLKDRVKKGTATFAERRELIRKWGYRLEENKVIESDNK